MRRIMAVAILAACLAADASLAQVETPRGGSQGSTLGIPPVTGPATGPATPGASDAPAPSAAPRTGKVKPPGSPLGDADRPRADLERRQRELDRRIRSGICRGC